VLESIITTGTVTRGWIGVEPQDVTPEIAESFGLDQKSGAIVAGVLQGGPADKAGIRPGDILVSINEDTITDTTRLLNVVAQIKPGTSVKVHLMRKNKELDVNVMIGKRPAPPRAPQMPDEDQGDQGDQGDE
jgi:serine protease DegQ